MSWTGEEEQCRLSYAEITCIVNKHVVPQRIMNYRKINSQK